MGKRWYSETGTILGNRHDIRKTVVLRVTLYGREKAYLRLEMGGCTRSHIAVIRNLPITLEYFSSASKRSVVFISERVEGEEERRSLIC